MKILFIAAGTLSRPLIGNRIISFKRMLVLAAALTASSAIAQESHQTQSQPGSTHVFTTYGNAQSTQQQVYLLSDDKPMPFSLSGNVQKWTTGPSQDNLYTQMLQGLVDLGSKTRLVFSQIYQTQGSIELANAAVGLNYTPTSDWSINTAIGFGVGHQYTYRYSLFFSPQYRLPVQSSGIHAMYAEASINYQNFTSGEFIQLVPKINIQLSETLPPLSVGYAFGTFRNNGPGQLNQYYQPKTRNGAMVSASVRSSDNSFLIFSYYPYNQNIIGGNLVVQDTVAATWNYKVARNLHLSVFGQYQNSRNVSTDLTFGGSINFSF